MSFPKVKKVISVRNYKAGYVIRKELISGKPYKGPDTEMRSAYTPKGDYIGGPKDARVLCDKKGIAPELASPKHSVCSIGKSNKDNKWYGWSHRAICGYKGSNAKQRAKAFAESVS